jgi:FOG: WD40 repeat
MRLLRTLSGDGDVTALAFSRDGRLASGSSDRTVRIWDLRVGEEPVALIQQPEGIQSLAFSPSGRELACACNDSVFWDTMTMERKLVLKGNKRTDHLAYSPSGERLATRDPAGIQFGMRRPASSCSLLPGRLYPAKLQSRRHAADRRHRFVAPRLGQQTADDRTSRGIRGQGRCSIPLCRVHPANGSPTLDTRDPLLRESLRARALSMAEEQADAAPPH